MAAIITDQIRILNAKNFVNDILVLSMFLLLNSCYKYFDSFEYFPLWSLKFVVWRSDNFDLQSLFSQKGKHVKCHKRCNNLPHMFHTQKKDHIVLISNHRNRTFIWSLSGNYKMLYDTKGKKLWGHQNTFIF